MHPLRWSVAAVGSLLMLALVPPRLAYAGPQALPPTEVVHFADLNLNTPAGVASLYRRIHQAALDVCEPLQRPGSLLPSGAWRDCMSKALSAAVRDVNLPALTAYHDRHEGQVIRKG